MIECKEAEGQSQDLTRSQRKVAHCCEEPVFTCWWWRHFPCCHDATPLLWVLDKCQRISRWSLQDMLHSSSGNSSSLWLLGRLCFGTCGWPLGLEDRHRESSLLAVGILEVNVEESGVGEGCVDRLLACVEPVHSPSNLCPLSVSSHFIRSRQQGTVIREPVTHTGTSQLLKLLEAMLLLGNFIWQSPRLSCGGRASRAHECGGLMPRASASIPALACSSAPIGANRGHRLLGWHICRARQWWWLLRLLCRCGLLCGLLASTGEEGLHCASVLSSHWIQHFEFYFSFCYWLPLTHQCIKRHRGHAYLHCCV
mmetsp:Transcript_78423/g.136061  ORF Transcript_78423/g.136061 Transcript_78423/m.136061 type:complete len:311 (-) Transcript_78423:806-1738(-)